MRSLLLSIFLFVSNIPFAQTIILNNQEEREVPTGFSYLHDTTKSLQVADVIQIFRTNNLKPPPKPFQTGFHVYWLSFSVSNQTGFDGEWVLDFQNWSYVDAYVNEGAKFKIHKSGHLYAYNKRDYKVANKAYILIPIKAGETKKCFVRIESRYNNELIPDTLNFKIAPRTLIDDRSLETGKVIYSFLAIFFVTFLYHMFIFWSTRLRSYALYLIVIFFAFYHTSYNSGYIIELFGSIGFFPVILTGFETVSSNLFGIAILLFAKEFLRTRERYPKWNKVINIILISYAVFGFILLINQEIGTITTSISGLATIVTIITLAIRSTREKYPSAGYFLIGYSAFLISVLVIILSYVEVLPKNNWTFSYSLPIGTAIQIILFSVALANMIKVLRLENEENQKKQLKYIQEREEMTFNFQQELLKTKLEIQEQTYHNISEELHDNIGQVLSLLKINMNTIDVNKPEIANEKLIESSNLITKVLQDLRDLSKTLNPDFIDKIGLVNAISQQLQIIKKTGLYVTGLSVTGQESKYESHRELVLFRIVQELLNNIVKHAEATTIDIFMKYDIDKLVITLIDNGKGLDIEKSQFFDNKGGQGLRNIQHRKALINGSISFLSETQKGTTVTIELPK